MVNSPNDELSLKEGAVNKISRKNLVNLEKVQHRRQNSTPSSNSTTSFLMFFVTFSLCCELKIPKTIFPLKNITHLIHAILYVILLLSISLNTHTSFGLYRTFSCLFIPCFVYLKH